MKVGLPYAICKSVPKLTGVADGLAVQEVLNSALKEDKLDDGCVRSVAYDTLQTAANEYPD